MRWRRSRKHIGSCLALLALWVQFALTFSHLHPEDFAAAFAGPGLSAPAPAGPAAQPSDHGKGLAHDDCAICAFIFLAGTALPGHPPRLVTPAIVRPPSLPQALASDPPPGRYLAFRTRAPPPA
jgi:hypothetical protein